MRRLVATATALLLLATGCGLGNGDGDAITIGAIYPMSGSQGPGGVEESRGAQVAVELVNRDGGVDGRKVKLKLVDVDVGSAAPKAMRDLHADGIDLVIGTYGSTISAPAAEVAAQEDMLLWETGAVGEMTGPAPASRSSASPPRAVTSVGARWSSSATSWPR